MMSDKKNSHEFIFAAVMSPCTLLCVILAAASLVAVVPAMMAQGKKNSPERNANSVGGAARRGIKSKAEHGEKIELNLNQLDQEGLRGSAGGKVAVSYEFSIPEMAKCKAAVKAIDPTIPFMSGSAGRVGSGKEQCLCVGTTHKKNYRGVLKRLATLSYVRRIIECHYE